MTIDQADGSHRYIEQALCRLRDAVEARFGCGVEHLQREQVGKARLVVGGNGGVSHG